MAFPGKTHFILSFWFIGNVVEHFGIKKKPLFLVYKECFVPKTSYDLNTAKPL